jgi:cyclic pyranopterin phosphate synthase
MSMQPLSHFNDSGRAHMVDVGAKVVTLREAIAEAHITMSAEAAQAIRSGNLAKGDVLQIATVAAIQAAKQTAHWIPLCHIVPLEHVEVGFQWPETERLQILVTVRTHGKTGVEMEALTAASAGALTVYDMCKSVDRGMTIQLVRLVQKTGGSKGSYKLDWRESAPTSSTSGMPQ